MKSFLILKILFISSSGLVQESLSIHFNKCNAKGSTTIYDYKNQKWLFSDSLDSEIATLPASTLKILNTLTAFETRVISHVNEVIRWQGLSDTVKYGYRPDIYRDMTVEKAFKYSAVWAYINIAERIGKQQYAEYLKLANYGNGDISINDPDFWNYGKFSVSPINQIQFLIAVHEESLPFSKSSFSTLNNLMI